MGFAKGRPRRPGLAADSEKIREGVGFPLLRVVLIAVGSLSAALGLIGVFIPVLPTTPLLLVAAACFSRSSPAAYRWLLDSPILGVYLRNYREGRGLPVPAKVLIIGLLWITIGYSALHVVPHAPVKVLLLLIALAVSIHIVRRPSWKPPRGSTEPCQEEAKSPSDNRTM